MAAAASRAFNLSEPRTEISLSVVTAKVDQEQMRIMPHLCPLLPLGTCPSINEDGVSEIDRSPLPGLRHLCRGMPREGHTAETGMKTIKS